MTNWPASSTWTRPSSLVALSNALTGAVGGVPSIQIIFLVPIRHATYNLRIPATAGGDRELSAIEMFQMAIARRVARQFVEHPNFDALITDQPIAPPAPASAAPQGASATTPARML